MSVRVAKQVKQGVVLTLIISSLGLSLNPLWISPARATTPAKGMNPVSAIEDAENQKLVDEIKKITEELRATRTNAFNTPIPKMEHPHEVTEAIDRLERILHSAQGKSFSRPEEARITVLTALEMLYKGRGVSTSPKDGTGWYPANRSGDTGLYEIRDILNRGLLDDQGKQMFAKFVQEYDFNDPSKKTQVGLSPTWNINDASIQHSIATDVLRAPSGPAFTARPPALTATGQVAAEKHKTVSELLDEQVKAGKLDNDDATELKKFVKSVDSNHYDKSVEIHNDPNKEFIKYFGREVESREMLDALSKIEKGHILLTGKAGVGKTTLLKILSDKFVQGSQSIHDEKPPIMLELPITTVTNPSDPTAPKNAVAGAKALSKALGRRVILYVDEAHISTPMTRNALKSFLTEMQRSIGDDPKVNMVWSTTSAEARDFLKDTAFSRRFTELHVSEFDRENTIKLIKVSNVPGWKKDHKKNGAEFAGIEDDAFEYAYRFGSTEQRHAGNPTGTKELLEAAITKKMNDMAEHGTKGQFVLTADDVRDYVSSKLKIPLIPGDPKFSGKFENMWTGFRDDYGGNDGAMSEMKQVLKDHFGSLVKNKMTAVVAFGPPGGGKSYGAEMVAKHYFNNAVLTINGAEYKNGGYELNKLIGSPGGTVNANDQISILTKFIQDHPAGGVIKIEEADYLHHDVIQLLTNMITDKKFTDGLGKEWDTSKYVLWQNTNIGQDLMIPLDAANKMNWEQYNTRRANLTEKVLIDGKPVERVKPDQMEALFDRYVGEIVEKSNPGGDTSSIAQEANKQKRRYKGIYILPPNKEEVMEAAQRKAKAFIKNAKLDYGVNIEISPESVAKALNIEHYQFEKGYSYAENQLQEKIFSKLTPYLGERGKTIKAHIEDTHIEYDGRQVPAQNLIVNTPDGKSDKFILGATVHEEKNPWGSNEVMMKRINNFQEEMGKYVKGNHEMYADMGTVLKSKAIDWNEGAVFTLLGTSGNGKTETFKAMAKVLFGDENAMFKITGVDHPWDLGDYFRPPTGVLGSNKETQFERWFKSRKSAGGGIILLDELMSEIGKNTSASVEGQKGGKIAVLQELYELLDERRLKINGKYEDARGFIIGITGNSLQELFSNLDDNPETEALVKKIREKLTRSEIVQNLERHGLDAPKIARLGHIYVMGPQPRSVSMGVGDIKIKNAINEIKRSMNNPHLEIVIPENATEAVVNRLSTVKLGMREVDEGFKTLMFRPLKTMMADIQRTKGHRIQKVEMKMPDGEHPQWFVDGQEVILEGKQLPNGGENRVWEFKKLVKSDAVNRTPTVHDLKSVEKMKYTPELLHEVAVHEVYGHWMVNAMLTRENGADFVSLIPGPGYLGYVRPKAQEVADVQNLSSVLKRMVELSAGHRSVFYHGSYATGGGNDGAARAEGKEAADDLGKIQKLKNMLINNGMFPGVREGSSGAEKAIASELIDKVVDRMADEVIHKGIESKEFEPVFNKVMKDRYLTKEDLDAFVHKVNYDKFHYQGRDGLFMETLSASIAKELEIMKGDPHYEQAKKLSSGLLQRTFDESMTRAKGKPAALAELEEIKSAVVAKVKEGKAHPRMELKCIKQHLEESLF